MNFLRKSIKKLQYSVIIPSSAKQHPAQWAYTANVLPCGQEINNSIGDNVCFFCGSVDAVADVLELHSQPVDQAAIVMIMKFIRVTFWQTGPRFLFPTRSGVWPRRRRRLRRRCPERRRNSSVTALGDVIVELLFEDRWCKILKIPRKFWGGRRHLHFLLPPGGYFGRLYSLSKIVGHHFVKGLYQKVRHKKNIQGMLMENSRGEFCRTPCRTCQLLAYFDSTTIVRWTICCVPAPLFGGREPFPSLAALREPIFSPWPDADPPPEHAKQPSCDSSSPGFQNVRSCSTMEGPRFTAPEYAEPTHPLPIFEVQNDCPWSTKYTSCSNRWCPFPTIPPLFIHFYPWSFSVCFFLILFSQNQKDAIFAYNPCSSSLFKVFLLLSKQCWVFQGAGEEKQKGKKNDGNNYQHLECPL